MTDPQIEHQRLAVRPRFGQDQTLQYYEIKTGGWLLLIKLSFEPAPARETNTQHKEHTPQFRAQRTPILVFGALCSVHPVAFTG